MSLTPEESAALWKLAETIISTAITAVKEAHTSNDAAAKQTLTDMAALALKQPDIITVAEGVDDAVADNALDAKFPPASDH